MVCKKCGVYLDSNAAFCHNCGARLIVGEEYSRVEKNCPLCNKLISVEDEVCPNCGAQLKQESGSESTFNEHSQQQQDTQTNIPPYVKSTDFVMNGPVPANQELEKSVSIGQYIGWMLLSMIPFAGFILTIVFACDSSKKSRANFFRALLILYGVFVVLCVLAFILFMFTGISYTGVLEDFAGIV